MSAPKHIPQQIPMGLPLPAAMGRADFFVTPANARALAVVEGWRNWPQGKLVLTGPEGAGKTHLAHLWAQEAGGVLVPAAALAKADLAALVARHARIGVEDIDSIAGCRAAEEALFHLHNLVAEAEGRLLLTARAAPARLPLGLPDLASRLEAAALVSLEAPDDALLQAVLVKLFADRQIAVSAQVVSFVLARMERSLAVAQRLVDALDRRALAGQARVSVALAAEVLARFGDDRE